MANQHKNPLIGWHSDDPTLKPWIKAEAERRGVTEKAFLDEVLSEYRHGGKHPSAPVGEGGNHTRRSAPKPTPAGRKSEPESASDIMTALRRRRTGGQP